eukprot:scaffold10838_cov99-Isochrysis_galbana.AAC.3
MAPSRALAAPRPWRSGEAFPAPLCVWCAGDDGISDAALAIASSGSSSLEPSGAKNPPAPE